MIAFVAPLKIKNVCFLINEMKHHVMHLPFHSFNNCFDTLMYFLHNPLAHLMPWWWRPCRRGSRAAPGRPARGCPGETARGSWSRAGSRPSDPPDPCSLKSGDRVMAEKVWSLYVRYKLLLLNGFTFVWIFACSNYLHIIKLNVELIGVTHSPHYKWLWVHDNWPDGRRFYMCK